MTFDFYFCIFAKNFNQINTAMNKKNPPAKPIAKTIEELIYDDTITERLKSRAAFLDDVLLTFGYAGQKKVTPGTPEADEILANARTLLPKHRPVYIISPSIARQLNTTRCTLLSVHCAAITLPQSHTTTKRTQAKQRLRSFVISGKVFG